MKIIKTIRLIFLENHLHNYIVFHFCSGKKSRLNKIHTIFGPFDVYKHTKHIHVLFLANRRLPKTLRVSLLGRARLTDSHWQLAHSSHIYVTMTSSFLARVRFVCLSHWQTQRGRRTNTSNVSALTIYDLCYHPHQVLSVNTLFFKNSPQGSSMISVDQR